MGGIGSGRYRDGKMTAHKRKAAVNLVIKRQWSVIKVAQHYGVDRQYIYQLLNKHYEKHPDI